MHGGHLLSCQWCALSPVVNQAFPVTRYVALGLDDLGGNAGLATFSHFVFTPLPGSRT
jgi:hypothetical protein